MAETDFDGLVLSGNIECAYNLIDFDNLDVYLLTLTSKTKGFLNNVEPRECERRI